MLCKTQLKGGEDTKKQLITRLACDELFYCYLAVWTFNGPG